ncbi:MAG: hypothetical protein ACXW2F_08985 [Thermoanaerobaculia bacterium]
MKRLALVALVLVAACSNDQSADPQGDWVHVLSRKKAAVAPDATPQAKQVYADSLAAFVAKHPRHSRARDVYHRVQLEFARELAAHGRYADAIGFYRAVLDDDPDNQAARKGAQEAADRMAVSRQKLLALQKGMSQSDVTHLLGKPMPGWKVRNRHRDAVLDAWYYRTTDGGIAGVYFRDGELLAAEEKSEAKLAPLTR